MEIKGKLFQQFRIDEIAERHLAFSANLPLASNGEHAATINIRTIIRTGSNKGRPAAA
jgi:hypothetical protein